MPLIAVLLGVLGLIPFIVCGLGALDANPVGAQRMLLALIGYGAVILSFLGGIHWGFALLPASPQILQAGLVPATPRRENRRLLLSVLPALAGWLAILATIVLVPWSGLIVLIAGFIAVAVMEQQAHGRGLALPPRWMWLRWALTVVIVMMLTTVLTLRLLGRSEAFY